MAMLTVRNISDEVHRALRTRAAQHGQSMEAEVQEILESVVSPAGRVTLGSLLADIGKRAKLSDDSSDRRSSRRGSFHRSSRWVAADGYIAAIAGANGFAVATRGTEPFEACGATVISPWQL